MPSEVKAMIMCDECGIRPANIHLTTIVDGEKKDVNLCAECLARKKELKIDFSALAGTIGQMLTSGVPPVRKSAPAQKKLKNNSVSSIDDSELFKPFWEIIEKDS